MEDQFKITNPFEIFKGRDTHLTRQFVQEMRQALALADEYGLREHSADHAARIDKARRVLKEFEAAFVSYANAAENVIQAAQNIPPRYDVNWGGKGALLVGEAPLDTRPFSEIVRELAEESRKMQKDRGYDAGGEVGGK